MIHQKKIGLSLSGGGYRASAFHLGTLKALHELKILENVDVLSTISGGSITGAAYCLSQSPFEAFYKAFRSDLNNKGVIKGVLQSGAFYRAFILFLLFIGSSIIALFTSSPWLSPVFLILFIILLFKYQFFIFPVSQIIEKIYNTFFFHHKNLKDLNDTPVLVIGSTNLQTGRPFAFSKKRMFDSSYEHPNDGNSPIYFNPDDFPIARAVMASTCVPFAFTPIKIDTTFYSNPLDSARINPQLVDGGVYDNQGIHKITQKGNTYECDIIITSDAGNKLPFESFYNNTIILLIRTVDVFMDRIKKFQMIQNIYENVETANKPIAYLSLGWNLDECIPRFINNLIDGNITKEVIEAHRIPIAWAEQPKHNTKELTELLTKNTNYHAILAKNVSNTELELARNVGTNLTKLSTEQIDCLIRQATNLTELQVKLYCPELTNYQSQ